MSRAGPKSFALHVHFLDYGMGLCHGRKGCSSGKTIGGVALLILIYNIITGFILLLPGSTAGLGLIWFVAAA